MPIYFDAWLLSMGDLDWLLLVWRRRPRVILTNSDITFKPHKLNYQMIRLRGLEPQERESILLRQKGKTLHQPSTRKFKGSPGTIKKYKKNIYMYIMYRICISVSIYMFWRCKQCKWHLDWPRGCWGFRWSKRGIHTETLGHPYI